MDILETIKQRLKQNEDTAKKFHEIEISILSILNFQDLCESLLTKISKKFNIPLVWLTIIEETPVSEHIKSINDSNILKSKTKFIPFTDFNAITDIKSPRTNKKYLINSLAPLLRNSNMNQFDHFCPENPTEKIGSIAIIPIALDNKIIGSLNLGDADIHRFEPGMDKSLLEQLAVKISLCFSNVAAHEKLKYLAFHDPLTGLLNRRVMDRILQRECARAKRYNSDLCLIFFDLDKFKSINDTYGHDKGDHALTITADIFNRLKRGSDIIARYAGDEFVAILPSTKKDQAEEFVLRVKNELLKNPIKTENKSGVKNNNFYIYTSHGISSFYEDNCKTPSELLKKADSRLYKVKADKK